MTWARSVSSAMTSVALSAAVATGAAPPSRKSTVRTSGTIRTCTRKPSLLRRVAAFSGWVPSSVKPDESTSALLRLRQIDLGGSRTAPSAPHLRSGHRELGRPKGQNVALEPAPDLALGSALSTLGVDVGGDGPTLDLVDDEPERAAGRAPSGLPDAR